MPSSKPKREIGMLAHTEIASTDPESTKRFLERVFGWSFEHVNGPSGELISFQTPGGARGSIRKTQPKESPLSLNYVLVENLDAMVSKITKMHGEIVLPRTDVPGMGSFFWFKLPGGPS
jgi:predicted enzyme related to lactoylglutathione lyase